MKLGPIEDLSNWLPPLGKSEASQHKDVHLIVGDNILPVIPAILSYRSDVFWDWIQNKSDLVCNEFKGCEKEFHQCLQILYGAEVIITPTNANVIYKFGHLYQISEMVSEVKGWISSDLEEGDFVTTLISFRENASSAFDEFESAGRKWLVEHSDAFLNACFDDIFKLKGVGYEIVITFLITRMAKNYFTFVTKSIIKGLDSKEIVFGTVFIMKKYMELLSSRDFWKYDFDVSAFSELCCRFNTGLEGKEDFMMLVDMMKLTAARIKPQDYHHLSSNLVNKLTMKTTTRDQISDFVQKSSLSKCYIIEIVAKWASQQDVEELEKSIHIIENLLNSSYYIIIEGNICNIYRELACSELNKYYTENDLTQIFPKKLKNRGPRRPSHIYFLWGHERSLFDHRPTLKELSTKVPGCCFVLKPHSVPQYDLNRSSRYHFCLRYTMNGQESFYSFIIGDMSDLERILGEASMLVLIGMRVFN